MLQFVTYCSVSTRDQGTSGRGIEAQTRDLDLFLASYAEQPWEVIGTFVEVYSGADDKPELLKALDLVRKHDATLLISKLDRLSRRVAFITDLVADPKVKLQAATMPYADKFQLHLFAALVEQERDFISTRTKAALAAARANGKVLGGRREKAAAAAAVRQNEARAREAEPAALALQLRTEGASLRQIARALAEAGETTANGGAWSATQVKRMLDRLPPGMTVTRP